LATSAVVQGAEFDFNRPPRPYLLLAIALAGCAAAAFTVASALESAYLTEPGIRAGFAVWVILPYVFGGLIAWWRRPENRIGLLMIFAGFGTFLAMLGWSNVDALHTLGQTLNFLPPILFLHVFLAFPSGRLERPVARAIVTAAYMTGIGLGLVRMLLGGFGPDGVFELTTEPGLADALERVQLVTSGACALAGIGVLVARRLGAGPPLRRSVALLTDSFAVGLLMIAVLAMRAAVGAPGHVTIQRLTYFVVGLAPFAFVIGLLHARLARSSVGNLFVELHADPAPGGLRDALARALRDPSLLLTAFRSFVVATQAAVANILSVAAAFGVLTAVFQWGWGLSLVGLDTASGTDPIASYVPLMMFAVLFGLSMDYQVFLISQIEHHRAAHERTREAVAGGLATGARVITAAALIMMSVFGSFIVNDDPTVKQFGVGLSVGVALAAMTVLLLAPAVLVPRWCGKLVDAGLAQSTPAARRHRRRDSPAGRLCGIVVRRPAVVSWPTLLVGRLHGSRPRPPRCRRRRARSRRRRRYRKH
jgi:MMPL family